MNAETKTGHPSVHCHQKPIKTITVFVALTWAPLSASEAAETPPSPPATAPSERLAPDICRTSAVSGAIDDALLLEEARLLVKSLEVLSDEAIAGCAAPACTRFGILRDNKSQPDAFTLARTIQTDARRISPQLQEKPAVARALEELAALQNASTSKPNPAAGAGYEQQYHALARSEIAAKDLEQRTLDAAKLCTELPFRGGAYEKTTRLMRENAFKYIWEHPHYAAVKENNIKKQRYITSGLVLFGLGAAAIVTSGVFVHYNGRVIDNSSCPTAGGIDGPCLTNYVPGYSTGFTLGGLGVAGSIPLFIIGCRFTKPQPYSCLEPEPSPGASPQPMPSMATSTVKVSIVTW